MSMGGDKIELEFQGKVGRFIVFDHADKNKVGTERMTPIVYLPEAAWDAGGQPIKLAVTVEIVKP